MSFLSALIGLTLAFSPPASAASPVCESIRSQQPVGQQYVSRILRRADDSIAFAVRETQSTDVMTGDDLLLHFFPNVTMASRTWLAMIDAQLTVQESTAGLTSDTACLAFDKTLIECKMEDVRGAMDTVLSSGRSGTFASMFYLSSALRFLQQSAKHLSTGALDPAYVDTTYGHVGLLDDPALSAWCCVPPKQAGANFPVATWSTIAACRADGGTPAATLEEAASRGCGIEGIAGGLVAPENRSLCPFHSNYGEPFMNGYGCDEVALSRISSIYAPAASELDALRTLTADSRKYATRTHKEAMGCALIQGYCEGKPDMRCGGDRDCERSGAGACIVAAGRCTGNAIFACDSDAQCQSLQAGTCVLAKDASVPLLSETNPFSITPDYWTLLKTFLNRRVLQGGSREFPDYLKLPGEFRQDQTQQRMNAELEVLRPFLSAGPRRTLWLWSREQGKDEAAIFPLASDMPTAGNQALQKEISRFQKLSHDLEGVRRLLIDTAFFLRISCAYRPCALRLEHILKMAFKDECFPFTNGEYLGDTEQNPRWKKCMDAAGITIE